MFIQWHRDVMASSEVAAPGPLSMTCRKKKRQNEDSSCQGLSLRDRQQVPEFNNIAFERVPPGKKGPGLRQNGFLNEAAQDPFQLKSCCLSIDVSRSRLTDIEGARGLDCGNATIDFDLGSEKKQCSVSECTACCLNLSIAFLFK